MIIKIAADAQQLTLEKDAKIVKTYSISTARKGLGELRDSEMTPRGWHQIKLKIGQGALINTVFVGRRETGEVYSPMLAKCYPERDWILTRIIWLSGLESGFNRYGLVDTFKRYIYIHGCPEEIALGTPLSHGCIRMHNREIIELFDLIPLGTRVLIT